MTKNYCKDRKWLEEFAGGLNYHPYRVFQREKLRKLDKNKTINAEVSAIVQTTTWFTTNANATRPTLESKQDPIKNVKLYI
jgi:hypothetical protein